MSNSWDQMKKAKEDSYFAKKEQEALARLAKRKDQAQAKISPVSGQPMEEVVLNGVVVDRCPVSGGIWLDAGELEQLLELARSEGGGNPDESWISRFARDVASWKKK